MLRYAHAHTILCFFFPALFGRYLCYHYHNLWQYVQLTFVSKK
jgi:hypothetical protein